MTPVTDLAGFSRGMFSNWLWHRPLQLVVDAGEGLQLALGSSVFAPSWLAITHGHSDHVLGLPGFLAARRFGKGAQEKPITVVYPDGSRGVQAVRDLMATAYAGVSFAVTWLPMRDGDTLPMGKGRTLEAFAVRHNPGEPALGYRVVEPRRRLKPEFRDWTREAIEAHARAGHRQAMLESVTHVAFAHSGDAMPIDPGLVRHADLLVHDATFLVVADRREPIHASTEEALGVARDANVAALVLQHLSIRYPRPAAIEALRQQVAASGYAGRAWLLDDQAFTPLSPRTVV
jgi:ribonuclease Z